MELKPTFLAGVPRVFEKIHEGKEILVLNDFGQTLTKIGLICIFRYKKGITRTQSSTEEYF